MKMACIDSSALSYPCTPYLVFGVTEMEYSSMVICSAMSIHFNAHMVHCSSSSTIRPIRTYLEMHSPYRPPKV